MDLAVWLMKGQVEVNKKEGKVSWISFFLFLKNGSIKLSISNSFEPELKLALKLRMSIISNYLDSNTSSGKSTKLNP